MFNMSGACKHQSWHLLYLHTEQVKLDELGFLHVYVPAIIVIIKTTYYNNVQLIYNGQGHI